MLESVVERLEDAVAIFNVQGEMLFANPAMHDLVPGSEGGGSRVRLPPEWRDMVQRTIATCQSYGPLSVTQPGGRTDDSARAAEWLVTTHAIQDVDERLMGVMVVARNLEYLTQVQSTLQYSRKLTALGRLSAGVAHEVKNPLNAMMIHLELLRQKLAGRPALVGAARREGPASMASGPAIDVNAALDHVSIIAAEIRRLDQVLQGFLKFTRPEDLRLQPVHVPALPETPADALEGAGGDHELWALVLEAARLDEMVEQVVRSLEFSVLAKWSFGLAQAFNAFYHRAPIHNEERQDVRRWRAAGVAFFRTQLTRALDLMGIPVPPRM